MSTPKPGQKVRGSNSGQPIMAIFDLLGKRWALGIIWQLGNDTLTFRELQNRCDTISPGVLNTRIKELREADIVERSIDGYQLTTRGNELRVALTPIGEWSVTWAKEVYDYNKKK
ncbi:MAG: helix-turn-helix transcriptional regulator [Clostridiales bacterium]|nr:helix-turn-helix transcriptional regulator [Clostridiales bacterium]